MALNVGWLGWELGAVSAEAEAKAEAKANPTDDYIIIITSVLWHGVLDRGWRVATASLLISYLNRLSYRQLLALQSSQT